MAVARAEFHINEAEALVRVLDEMRLDKLDPLFRARKEMRRSLAAGKAIEERELRQLAKQRRMASGRMAAREEALR
jgi:hypothetical protein